MQISGIAYTCAAAVALLFSGCGEVKGTNNPDGGGGGDGAIDPNADFTLSVDPASLTLPIASSAKVTVTVARSGGNTGDISLTATGLGSNLTAEFSPAAIPDGQTSSEVTITVKGGTAAGTSTVTITGTAGDKTHSSDVAVTSTTITVTGKVRGNRSGIRVGIIGKASLLSGSGGVFTFTDVTPPYDLYTLTDSGCGNSKTPFVFFMDDLTRTDPTITAATYNPNTICFFGTFCALPSPNTNITGTKSGTGNNTDSVIWAWSEGTFGSPVLNTNGSFSGNVSWCAGNTSTGSLQALQFTKRANGAPNVFLGYGKTQTTYTSGQNAVTNLTFAAVTSGTITGTLNAPPGYPAPDVSLTQQFGGTTGSLWQAQTTAIEATFPVIAAAGGTLLFATTTQAGVGTTSYVQPLTATTTIDFTMPTPAVLTAPANAATGVTTSTKLTWTTSPDVISRVNVSGAGAAFAIYTTNTEITLPVIPELALPAATQFSWSITGYAPMTSTNAAVAADELTTVGSTDFVGPTRASFSSASRTFTTQ